MVNFLVNISEAFVTRAHTPRTPDHFKLRFRYNAATATKTRELMKSVPRARRPRLTNLADERFRRRNSRKHRTYASTRYLPVVVDEKRPQKFTDVLVPPVLCLEAHYEACASFLYELRSTVETSKVTVRLRLEGCKTIRPAALLMLLAEVHRARLLRGDKALTGTYPEDPALLKRMCDMGFFEVLNIRSPVRSDQTFPMEYIKFKSGTQLEAESARALRESLLGEKIAMNTQPRKQLQRGVTEAMLNALQHAYPETAIHLGEAHKRWWLCGHYHRPSKRLSILFCDLGVGIPKTLPRRYPMEMVRKVLSLFPGVRPDDGAMIYAGMEIGRTRTKKEHRGKGLNDLRQFIDKAEAGEMHIYSRRGRYSYTSGGNESHKTFSAELGGTLIRWTVPINRVTNWSGDPDEGNANDQDSI